MVHIITYVYAIYIRHLACAALAAVSSEAVDKDLAHSLLLSIKANAQLKNLGMPSAVLVTLMFI